MPSPSCLRSLFIVLVLTFCTAANAQSPAFECSKREALKASDAKAQLEKVQGAYQGVKAISARFLQNSFLAALEAAEVSSGSVWFLKPGQMKWHYAEPEEQIFVVKDETLWLYQAAENQVLIDEFKKVLISDLPVSFLLGLGQLTRDFKIISACRNEDGLVFELAQHSASEDSELKGFKLLVDPSSYLPKGALVIDVAGNRTAVVLSELETSDKIAPETFSTAFKRGADVIDRRQKQVG